MKKTTVILFAAISPFSLFSNAQEITAPYFYKASLTSSPPIIDGELNDAAWHSAKTTKHFVFHHDNSKAPVVTWAKLTYDNDNLYIAYSAQDNDITSNFINHDDPIYKTDDTVEIFFDPDGDGLNYYEIGVSPYTAYDVVINTPTPWLDDKAWNIAGFEYASSVNGTVNDNNDIDQNYTVEIKIPFKSLNYSGNNEYENKLWRFNFFRADYSTGAPQWAANGWLSWSPIGSFGFHQPSKFAYLKFTDIPLWNNDTTYNKGDTVSYNGQTFTAQYYSSNAAPGYSSQDGWRIISDTETTYNHNLIYLKGDTVKYDNQVWKANWMTQGNIPSDSLDWSLIEEK